MSIARNYLPFLLGAISLIAVAACKPNATESGNTTPPNPMVFPEDTAHAARKPGKYCFNLKDSNLSIMGSLDYAANGSVEGNLRSTVVDETNGAEAVFNTSFKGDLRQDTLDVAILSDDTGSKAETREKWLWRANSLIQGKRTLQETVCL